MTLEPNIYFEHISNAHREDLEKCFNMSSQVQNRLRYNRERAWSRVWKTRKPLERALQNYILPHICSSPDYKYRPLQISYARVLICWPVRSAYVFLTETRRSGVSVDEKDGRRQTYTWFGPYSAIRLNLMNWVPRSHTSSTPLDTKRKCSNYGFKSGEELRPIQKTDSQLWKDFKNAH